MICVVQRVLESRVYVNGTICGEIKQGLLLLAGFEDEDGDEDILWMTKKIISLRIFKDADDLMNLNIQQVGGELLLVSQFTLHAKVKKGTRPSFARAAAADKAEHLYISFKEQLALQLGKPIQSGAFGADMKVHLINDGPVTIIIDTKNKQ